MNIIIEYKDALLLVLIFVSTTHLPEEEHSYPILQIPHYGLQPSIQ